MADQAINVALVLKIEIFVSPTVPGMAGGARSPVTLNANAEVVDSVFLTGCKQPVTAFYLHWVCLPAPVCSVSRTVTVSVVNI